MKDFTFIKIIKLALIVHFISGNQANLYAYLDPATGNIILQSILAALLGITIGIKLFWIYIVNGWKKLKSQLLPKL